MTIMMDDLKQLMNKYGVIPKEAIIDLSVCLNEHPRGESIKNNGIVIGSDFEHPDEYYPSYEIVISCWCTFYQEVLTKVKNWHVIDDIQLISAHYVLEKVKPYMDLKSISLNFEEYQRHLNDEAKAKIFTTIPDSVLNLLISLSDTIMNFSLLNYPLLKKLKCPITDGNDIYQLPTTLESLDVYSLKGDDDWIIFKESDKMFPNLIHFIVVGNGEFGDAGNAIRLMPKLSTFEYENWNNGCDINELGLPESTITSLTLKLAVITGFYSHLKLSNLQHLTIGGEDFPKALFFSGNELPRLKSFAFEEYSLRGRIENSGKLVFPQSLRSLSIEAHFGILGLILPPKLRSLSLIYTKFRQGMMFKLPENLNKLKICGTDINNLNNLHFPSGLMSVEIDYNYKLKSMVHTNLGELKNLFYVRINNNDLYDIDEPNKENKYKLNTLDSNYSDGESFYQKYADLTGDPNWLAREYMDDEEIQEYGIDSDYDWF